MNFYNILMKRNAVDVLKSPCTSPEENAENHAQNEQLRRSGDTGDICSRNIIVITVTITLYSLAYDRQCIFSSTSCSQDLSSKHNSKAHACVHRPLFHS
jgi:hypothetical protein